MNIEYRISKRIECDYTCIYSEMNGSHFIVHGSVEFK